MSNFLFYPLVFVLMLITDFVWAEYMSAVAKKFPIRASCWAVGTVVMGALVVLSYVHDHWALIPAGLGSFVGTYISVSRK